MNLKVYYDAEEIERDTIENIVGYDNIGTGTDFETGQSDIEFDIVSIPTPKTILKLLKMGCELHMSM